MYTIGIDIGSMSTNGILLNDKKEILSATIIATGASSKKAAEKTLQQIFTEHNLTEKDINYIVATGYGRVKVPFANEVITEITCHAKGANYYFPDARTIIDIGGQDSKVIKIDGNGNVLDFVMNDKCAAGTGRFLEVMARTLEIELEEMGEISLHGKDNVSVSSLCTVFAESEVVSLIGADHKTADICRGLHISIAKRITAQVKRVGLEQKVAMTGGVAKNIGVVTELEKNLGCKIEISGEPQINGALGAALIALEKAQAQSNVSVSLSGSDNSKSLLETSIADFSIEESNLPKIGYFCSYTPVEIIHAAGFHPVRIKGTEHDSCAADEVLCGNICPYIKAVTDRKIEGSLEDFQGMVFVNSCDGMRRLYDAWVKMDEGKGRFNYMLDIPKNIDDAAVYYYANLLKKFKEKLESYFTMKILPDDINRSIVVYNSVREKVGQCLQKYWNGYIAHSGYEMFSLLKKGVNAVPEKFNTYLTHIIKQGEGVRDTREVPRLFIWGSIMENEKIMKIIEDAGAKVVAEDLCNGSRYFDAVVSINEEPILSIAKRYIKRSPCSRMENIFDRINKALTIMQEKSIHAAIYHTLKFCDHNLLDYPMIKKTFYEKNIPLLHLNCDYSLSSEGQIKTRVEAFLEQLMVAPK
ncbi:benzoyl-CoA reductase subunit BadG [Candidatus Kuenenia stuttgartiensis]|uniref:Benzoyl-CoA reductase subunit BadG n=1 Tax=Kuenenia stuttgartiensis TaxID=174633 RepID=Q1Q1I6_KUEST|nr:MULTISPECIES: acyl-CoA dehydratase activase [Kuenenia]MBW7942399.1 2-hydroxyacyl-CoA dehydratase [Candidatus Kuenenia stuttgartiensis]MBZ0191871.1 acyl-CoA dehydratase activase [Candidatus Kuenenia stuttgartiensis]MCL4726707.1 2-hydroxyacyl-CoA dehydratase [Candidatus Kuenenia stuttgartiensis]MCZ7623751.1 acyl-CoA dehydratase activase [Candidatus Kuenenia sp.]QII10901.1 benzoyl-CoA reductase subunit BadG [Candidatus Kuenenia stuttgartiensis]